MKPRLIILATSTDVRRYVNVVCHVLDRGMAEQAVFVMIDDPMAKESGAEAASPEKGKPSSAETLKIEVRGRISELAKAYGDVYERTNARYAEFGGKVLDHQMIKHEDLDRKIAAWIRERCIFDLTTLQKGHFAEVISIMLSFQYSSAFAWKFEKVPSHDDSDLIHRLREHTHYSYASVADSGPMRVAFRRMRRWSVDAKTAGLVIGLTIIVTSSLTLLGLLDAFPYINNGASVVGILGSLAVFVRSRRIE